MIMIYHLTPRNSMHMAAQNADVCTFLYWISCIGDLGSATGVVFFKGKTGIGRKMAPFRYRRLSFLERHKFLFSKSYYLRPRSGLMLKV